MSWIELGPVAVSSWTRKHSRSSFTPGHACCVPVARNSCLLPAGLEFGPDSHSASSRSSVTDAHGIVGSFGSGQTPRACEVRSKKWLFVVVRLGVILLQQKTDSQKSSIRAGRLQKTTNFRSFWGWLTLLTLFIHALISVPHRDSQSACR